MTTTIIVDGDELWTLEIDCLGGRGFQITDASGRLSFDGQNSLETLGHLARLIYENRKLRTHTTLLANNIADAKARLRAAAIDSPMPGATSAAEWRDVAREVVGMLDRK